MTFPAPLRLLWRFFCSPVGGVVLILWFIGASGDVPPETLSVLALLAFVYVKARGKQTRRFFWRFYPPLSAAGREAREAEGFRS